MHREEASKLPVGSIWEHTGIRCGLWKWKLADRQLCYFKQTSRATSASGKLRTPDRLPCAPVSLFPPAGYNSKAVAHSVTHFTERKLPQCACDAAQQRI